MERWARVVAACMALGVATAGTARAGEQPVQAGVEKRMAEPANATAAPAAGMRIHWDPATGTLAPVGAKAGAQLLLPRPDYGAVRPRLTARGHLEIPATVRMATVARLDADGGLQLDCLQHGVAHAPHEIASGQPRDTGTEGR